jgi:hypothetical protein
MENEQELTREQELLKMEKQELINEVLRLERKFTEEKSTRIMYCEMYHEADEKYNRYRDAVRSVVLFID